MKYTLIAAIIAIGVLGLTSLAPATTSVAAAYTPAAVSFAKVEAADDCHWYTINDCDQAVPKDPNPLGRSASNPDWECNGAPATTDCCAITIHVAPQKCQDVGVTVPNGETIWNNGACKCDHAWCFWGPMQGPSADDHKCTDGTCEDIGANGCGDSQCCDP